MTYAYSPFAVSCMVHTLLGITSLSILPNRLQSVDKQSVQSLVSKLFIHFSLEFYTLAISLDISPSAVEVAGTECSHFDFYCRVAEFCVRMISLESVFEFCRVFTMNHFTMATYSALGSALALVRAYCVDVHLGSCGRQVEMHYCTRVLWEGFIPRSPTKRSQ